MDQRRFQRLSRGMTLAWGFVLIGFGLVKYSHLLETGLTVSSFPFGSLLGLFLLGTLDRRANAFGAILGMIVGLLAVVSVFFFTGIAYTWYVPIGSLTTFMVGSIASRIALSQESVRGELDTHQ